jgi:hypothetical protein
MRPEDACIKLKNLKRPPPSSNLGYISKSKYGGSESHCNTSKVISINLVGKRAIPWVRQMVAVKAAFAYHPGIMGTGALIVRGLQTGNTCCTFWYYIRDNKARKCLEKAERSGYQGQMGSSEHCWSWGKE